MILSYSRVSTVEQAGKGATSLSEQARKTKGWAMMRGVDTFEIVDYVDAGVSGSLALSDRPQGGRMLTEARPGDTIVAVKLDRLFRSASDALGTVEDLKRRGIHLVLLDMGNDPLTGTGAAKFFFNVLASLADFEREMIYDRMQSGRAAKRLQGGRIGAVPYGWCAVGAGRAARLEPVVAEQEVIRLATSMARQRKPSGVCRALNAQGFRTRSGKEFQIVQVMRILDSAKLRLSAN